MFIGWRGTVRAAPTGRGALSRDASEATTVTPAADSAGARFGLSWVTCGSATRPECSPVTSSLALTLMPLPRAQVRLSVTCDWMSAWDTHTGLPEASVWQRHGVTVKSCTQPRYRWLYVWLSQRNCAR